MDPRSESNGPAVRAFVDFVDAMHAWEMRNYLVIAPLLEKRKAVVKEMDDAQRELAGIFAQHLVPGSCDRRRMDSGGIGYPPTYDADRDVIKLEKAIPGEVTFRYAQTTRPKSKLRFTMKRTGNTWRVHSGEIFDARRSKWLPFVI
ncbi:NTF2 fold immunity protein [Arthrobacter bambusae]|uniref:NTF2 fold immunity protein n=1 Tax=Arthrobacter bambusae TaxID=1338426 RepID=UPI002789F6FC|nr:NTF2 fold immunity protein [Arthrobacter bambusae]MDQ0029698.1 hypothetical protein [Arthrobacter bambusae]MDQ0097359.1 hypothetical protein [Arthrobacter bambusae]